MGSVARRTNRDRGALLIDLGAGILDGLGPQRLLGGDHRGELVGRLHVRLGDTVAAGQPLFTLHAESPGELAYAQAYLATHPDIFVVGETP